MKLKYYLRGLGIGIAVTALVMGLAITKNTKGSMTDEEVKEKLREIAAMYEQTVNAIRRYEAENP